MTESLFTVQDEPRIPYPNLGEDINAFMVRLVDALRLSLRDNSVQLNNTAMGVVDNYAALPTAARSEGRIYFLRDGTGPPAGNWFGSDATTWILLG